MVQWFRMADASNAPSAGDGGVVDRAQGLKQLPLLARTALTMAWRSGRRQFLVLSVLQLCSAAILAAQLLLVRELIAELLTVAQRPEASVSGAIPAFGALLVATLLTGALAAITERQQRLLAELVARFSLDEVVGVASHLPLAKFEDADFYDQLDRATNAASYRPMQLVESLVGLLVAALTSIGVVVALLLLEPLLVPTALLAGAPLLIASLVNSRQSYVFEYAMTPNSRERLHLLELMTGRDEAKELRIFSATGYLRRRYDALSDERLERLREFLGRRLRVALLGTGASALGGGVALAALIYLLSSGRMSVETTVTAAVALQVLSGRVATMVRAVGRLVEAGLFIRDVQAFIELGERVGEPEQHSSDSPRFDHLQVHDLSFAYPGTDRLVLDGVSMEVKRGEVVALVGENGSGKTTLVKLLCKLYEAQGSHIAWNGRPVSEVPNEEIRAAITVLFQDFVRYHLTARENVILGRSDASVNEYLIEGALVRAGAATLVERLPRGLDTRLGRQFFGGFELSGGEWQRLAMARAFYRGGDLLILDEPTAALDPRAEFELFERIREFAAGKSVILISHRFANVRMADRIYVMESGRVVETGDHHSLMVEGGLYAELFRLQAAGYTDDAPTT